MSTPLRSPLTGLAIYNPDLLRKEDLIVQFVARQSLLDLLVDDLRRASASGGIQHHLIIGQRGMGKTTLLRRLRFAIEDDPALSKCWFPLTFPEEQYNITRMSDFWANCLDALGDMLDEQGREAEAEQFDEAVKNLPDDEPQRSRVALDMLTQWAERADKRLVLLLDNADLILERLHKHHWELREVLSHNDRLVFIGAASSSISATYEYAGAFYDFFQVHELRGLNMEETRAVLLKLAELRHTPHVAEIVERDPGRIQALRVLTGGNTRVLVVLYQVLAQEKDGSVVSELEQVLDLHTPYYKAVFEALATQAQQIVGAMCLHWNPITAAELAALPSVRLETNVVSAQLDRLTKDGVVEKAPTPPGEKLLYQVAERFFNIWYLMRASRRLRRKLIWLVDFLKIFYASADLHERARRFLKSEPVSRRADMAFAYAQTVDDPALRHALEYEGIRSILSERREYRKALGTMLDFESDDFLLKTHAERMAELHEIKQRILTAKIDWPDCTAEEFWQRLGGSWALSLEEKKDITDRLHILSAQKIRAVLKNAARQQRRLSALLGPERTETLMEAMRSGDMADVTDVEGADAAAIRLSAPSLKAIARIELARKKPSPLPINDIDEIRQVSALDTNYAYPSYSLGAFLAEHPDLHSEAETCYRKALEVFPNHPYLWDGLGDLLSDHLMHYDEAEAAYRKAIKLDPSNAYLWTGLGLLLSNHLKRDDEAEAAYRKAIKLDPDYIWSWNNLGNLLSDHLERYDEAEAVYRKAIELDPSNAWLWNGLGALFHNKLKRYNEAEMAYRKAIELDPNFAAPWNNLGNLLSDYLERYDEAEAAYRKAIELTPSDAYPWNGLGTLFHNKLKRYDEAEMAYRKAIELDPNYTQPWDNLGNLLSIHFKHYDEAEVAYHKAIELDPSNAYPWNGLGNLLSDHLKRYDEAEVAYHKAIELDPNFAAPWNNLGNLLSDHLKRYEEAEAAYRKAIELTPSDAYPWNGLGTLFHNKLKRYDEAEMAYRKAIELDPNYTQPWDNLGNLLSIHFKHYDEAEVAYRKAIELDPSNAYPWNGLGNLLRNHLERYDEAEMAYRKAIELDPSNAYPWNNLGALFHYDLKRYDDAEVPYRKAIELDPNFAAPWNNLGNLLSDHLKRYEEAEAAYRKAVALVPNDDERLDSLAWFLFLADKNIEEAEEKARQALVISPDDLYIIHTLACILARRAKWEEAILMARRFIVEGDTDYHAKIWPHIVTFFKEAVKAGHEADAVELLDDIGYEDRWRPLREALRAIAAGSDAPLLRVAPEIRQPAEELVAQLLPAGVKLASAIKTPREQRPRRKKNV